MALGAVPDHENAPKPLEVFGFGRAHEVNSSEPADEFSREKSKVSVSLQLQCCKQRYFRPPFTMPCEARAPRADALLHFDL